MKKEKSNNSKDVGRYNGKARMEELERVVFNIPEEIRIPRIKSKRELAEDVKQTIATLNKQISEARSWGITIDLSTDCAYAFSGAPAIQANIYEKLTL